MQELNFLRKASDFNPAINEAKEQFLAQHIERCVERQEPIEFVLQGFSGKSTNVQSKVLGRFPDFADQFAMHTLQKLTKNIAKHYQPGVNITIVLDGEAFADIVGIRDSTMQIYQIELAEIVRDPHMRCVRASSIGQHADAERFRMYLDRIGPREQDIKMRITEDINARQTYVQLSRVIHEDLDGDMSAKQKKNLSKQLAIRMVQREAALDQLVSKHFPEAIRLSTHRQPHAHTILGINLVPHQEGTPTHRVAVIHKDGSVGLVKRAEAEKAGYELFYRHGQPYGFIER